MRWNDDELVVLFAIFTHQPFKAGDDSHPVNQRIATALDRSPGAVDRQWRNLKHVLWGLEHPSNIGDNVVRIVEEYKSDLPALYQEAQDAMDDHGWDLEDLME